MGQCDIPQTRPLSPGLALARTDGDPRAMFGSDGPSRHMSTQFRIFGDLSRRKIRIKRSTPRGGVRNACADLKLIQVRSYRAHHKH